MSTTITCLEKIDIRRGDKDADDARLYLVKYLHQFIDMVGILSLEVYDFAIEIEGDLISWCEGKIGGSKSQPKKFEWEEEIVKHRAVDAIDCILNDVDATVILSFDTLPRLKSWDSTSTMPLADPVLRLSVTAWCPIRESIFT